MQEVIIYRNPLEAHIWHSFMNSDANIGLAILALCVVMFVSVFILMPLQEKVFPLMKRDTGTRLVLFISFLLGVVACYFTL